MAGDKDNATPDPTTSWEPYDLPKLEQTTLVSQAGAPYRIIVATPVGPPPSKGYPVIYIVDGNAWTSLASEFIRVNKPFGIQSRVEAAVVVGIGYPTSEIVDLVRRKLDLTPPEISGAGGLITGEGQSGGDIAFMDFIDNMVKPLVEKRFDVDRNRQTLIGHSFGGLFTISTMLNRPSSYQTYVAISPSTWWNNNGEMLRKTEDFLQTALPQDLRVFLAVGLLEQDFTPTYTARNRAVLRSSSEGKKNTDAEADEQLSQLQDKRMVSNAREMAAALRGGNIKTVFHEFPEEDHMSVAPAALNRAISYAFDNSLSRE